MEKTNKKKNLILFYVFTLILVNLVYWRLHSIKQVKNDNTSTPIKLYWFIPDGLRADPVTFNIYKWADEGKLPNIKLLMKMGSRGYSIPVFPGHTPTNFATLMTGSTPDVHGIADGPMRTEGYPLSMVSKGGFTSQAKKVSPIWYTLEQNNLLVSLLSIPGSTPPELNDGITIKGRWGGWGIEIPAIIFHSEGDQVLKVENGQNKRVFNFGSELTKFVNSKKISGWKINPPSFSHPYEVDFTNWNAPLYGYIVDSTDDQKVNYDKIIFSKDKNKILAEVNLDSWSDWLPVKLKYEMKNDYNINTPKKSEIERDISAIDLMTEMKIKVIKLGDNGYFRVRIIYNNLNEFLVKPSYLFDQIQSSMGPMVDFVDNYPPQLIYFKEDKKTFIEEANFSFDWHNKMAKYMIKNFGSNVIIHSIYTPNQMLTSRWWMPYLDPTSPRYNKVTESERAILWNEVLGMYQQIDKVIGTVLKNTDEKTYIVLSSDHGAIPLYKEVRLNNLFAKKGWLKFKYIPSKEEFEIDWEKTKVIFLQMDNVYIHTKGFKGPYHRDSGLEYEALRNEVAQAISELKDENGLPPLAQILKHEEAKKLLLPEDRTGDLIIANSAHYNWVEDVSNDLSIFKESLKGGYKQAVIPSDNQGMWTPFIIVGPNVKKDFEIKEPIHHIDQYSTLMKLLNVEPAKNANGKVLKEILIN